MGNRNRFPIKISKKKGVWLMLTLLLSATPDKEASLITWILFIAQKYSSLFLSATIVTLEVAVAGTILGFILGFFVGVVNTTKIQPEDSAIRKFFFRILRGIVYVYVEVFRDTPMIVQGMVVYYGLRQSGVMIGSIAAGILVTLLNTGAYMGETVRGGINSIDHGQEEGALAMGMNHVGAMIYVILPQALKNVFPEMGNTFLNNLKMTSVLNVIGVSELFLSAKTAGGTYYKYFEAYLVIALIYFVLCFVFNQIFMFLEKKMAGRSDYELATEYIDSE